VSDHLLLGIDGFLHQSPPPIGEQDSKNQQCKFPMGAAAGILIQVTACLAIVPK
jgi:hypothetical protein